MHDPRVTRSRLLPLASRALVVAVLSIFATAPLLAQRVETGGLAAELRSVRSGGEVRASIAKSSFTGRIVGVSTDSLTLDLGTSRQALALAGIDSVWVRTSSESRGAARGGMIGAIVLGGGLALIGASLCESDSGCNGALARYALGGAVVGGTFGLLIGSTIGSSRSHWKRVHP